MTDCPDWRRSLRLASFRGVSFLIETESASGGRRIVHHEFPHREMPYNEDLGQALRKYSLSAYVTGQQAGGKAQSLIAALSAPGPATLVLPMLGPKMAVCPSFSMDRARDRAGYVAFKLEFVEDAGFLPLLPFPVLGRLVEVAADALRVPASAAFGQSFKTTGLPGFVRDQAASLVSQLGTDILGSLGAFSAQKSGAAKIGRLAERLKTSPGQWASAGKTADVFEKNRFVQAAGSTTSSLSAAVFDIFGALGAAMTPATSAQILLPYLTYGDAPLAGKQAGTGAQKQAVQNHKAILALVRRAALAQYTVAVTSVSYETRQSAVQARADISEYLGFEMDAASLEGGDGALVFTALAELRGKAADFISQTLTDQAPLIFIEAPKRMPSLYWANRIYGDAKRAAELSQRNGVIHPSFMPTSFETKSR